MGVYGAPIIEKTEILEKEFDYVLIAVYAFASIEEIMNELMLIGVAEEKIKPIALGTEFDDIFMDQRMYWIKELSAWCYQEGIQGM